MGNRYRRECVRNRAILRSLDKCAPSCGGKTTLRRTTSSKPEWRSICSAGTEAQIIGLQNRTAFTGLWKHRSQEVGRAPEPRIIGGAANSILELSRCTFGMPSSRRLHAEFIRHRVLGGAISLGEVKYGQLPSQLLVHPLLHPWFLFWPARMRLLAA